MKAQIGMVGLAVMGKNLALNIRDHGFKVAVYEYTEGVADAFVDAETENTAAIESAEMISTNSLQELVDSLQTPRVVFMMVRAGDVVDFYIDKLVPLLSEGDIIVDGGNSLYTDTNRRVAALSEKGLSFIGMGVSGGEEGAHYGASMMPGGNRAGWAIVKPIFQAISAKVDG
ncbi:MAG: NADP-dependent phosphogluconate dehydrogenase, partial [Methylococcaceae bacterium]|nr:NADP-dependent phosphogluconate dehydrogenase [Methylococcaceae bacterium]